MNLFYFNAIVPAIVALILRYKVWDSRHDQNSAIAPTSVADIAKIMPEIKSAGQNTPRNTFSRKSEDKKMLRSF